MQTDSTGLFSLPNLTPGDYEISISADRFATKVVNVTVAEGAAQSINVCSGGAASAASSPGWEPAECSLQQQDRTFASGVGFPSGSNPGESQGAGLAG